MGKHADFRGEKNPFFGKKHSAESREKMRRAKLGKKRPAFTEEHKIKIGQGNKGKIRSKEVRESISRRQKGQWTGEKNPNWKGDSAGYFSIHGWVIRQKGKADHCTKCGTTTAKRYEWANVDHQYRRNLDDYIPMCQSCHMRYDKKHGYGKRK
jgi:hypothetical protein